MDITMTRNGLYGLADISNATEADGLVNAPNVLSRPKHSPRISPS